MHTEQTFPSRRAGLFYFYMNLEECVEMYEHRKFPSRRAGLFYFYLVPKSAA